MSEVLIRMKMPQCCEECRFFAWKRGVGQHCAVDDRITFHATLDGFDVGYERNGDCPLAPVPSHGRLIDADALKEAFCGNCFADEKPMECSEPCMDMRIILETPTIIPAEEK